MTSPGEAGKVTIGVDYDVHDAPKKLEDAIRHDEPKYERTGRTVGDAISDGVEGQIKRRASRFTQIVEEHLRKEHIHTTVEVDVDEDKSVVRKVARKVDHFAEEVADNLGNGRGFGRIGQVFQDAIGAGFNVSGKSPLIAVLALVVGGIVVLVAGLIQLIQGLIALLYAVPNLILAIGLQVGILYLAFQGLGTAIQGAFAAQNAYELNEAIKNLTPSAQEFVKSLLPLKGIFDGLKNIAQEGFFKGLGDSFSRLVTTITPLLDTIAGPLATALGQLLNKILTFFSSPIFGVLLYKVAESTVKWLTDLGPALIIFLDGLSKMGIALIPFLDKVGEGFNWLLKTIGDWLGKLGKDPKFMKFLDDMLTTLMLAAPLFGSILGFLVDFGNALTQAGGNGVLGFLIEAFNQLGDFFRSEIGVRSLRALLGIAVELTIILMALFETIMFFLASLDAFFDWLLNTAFPAFVDFLGGLIDFFTHVGPYVTGALMAVGQEVLTLITDYIVSPFTNALGNIKTWITETLPNNIKNWVTGIGTWLLDAGRNLIQGLINGIKGAIPGLGPVMDGVAGFISKFFPHSPAILGPLSGEGDPYKSGQEIVSRLGSGMEGGTPALDSSLTNVLNNVTAMLPGAGAAPAAPAGKAPTPVTNVRIQIGDKDITDIAAIEITKLTQHLTNSLLFGTRSG